ncbi:MAG: response regulator [Elusimicrobia bacterium]|nr:response regulator [Elusimicrobiota bacterium]
MASEYDVLIVDDDAIQANLMLETLEDLGFSARILPDGSRVLAETKRAMPRLIILDIIMPGTDGLTLALKLRPLLREWDGKMIVTSGKDRKKEEPRALKAGAAAFLQKPFHIADLRKVVDGTLGAPYATPPRPAAEVGVRVWGTRGPGTPAAGESAYGTHSPCVSVGLASGEIYILDAGTGIRACSETILASPQVTGATLLLTHYHPAHIEALRGLPLLDKAGFTLRVMGPADPDVNLAELCVGLGAKATVHPFTIEEKNYALSANVRLGAAYMNHPTTTLGYWLEAAGRKIVYCPDAELANEGEVEVTNNMERLRLFSQGADLLLFDSHFAPEDLAAGRDEGHSSWQAAVRLAKEAGVRRLGLFHLSRKYADAQVAAMEAAARQALGKAATSIPCEVAKEGLSIAL